MNVLILVAHGSKRKQANDEVEILAKKLRTACHIRYHMILVAFLEMAKPRLTNCLRHYAKEHAESITVLPYFLNSGKHVVVDIPKIVDDCATEYPETLYKILPHIGSSKIIYNALSSLLKSEVT